MRFPRRIVRVAVWLLQWLPQRLPISTQARRRALELSARALRLPRAVTVTREQLGGVPAARFQHRDANPERAVLHLHGGAYTTCSSRTHAGFAAHLSVATGAPVHVPDYRLAPEHPYPAAIEDAVAAYRGLLEAGLASDQVAVSGDSAGGGLTLALCLRLRDLGEPLPTGLALLCPWLDLTLSGESLRRNLRRDAGLYGPSLRADAAAYCGSSDPLAPELSPLGADLEGLPPIHLQGAADDVLVSDADRFAKRARAAGVLSDYGRFEGVWHDFQLVAGPLGDADQAVLDIAHALEACWAPHQVAEGA